MWSRVDIKERGKAAMKANYWRSVGAAVLFSILSAGVMSGASSSSGGDSVNTANLSPEEQLAYILTGLGMALLVSMGGILLRIFVYDPLEVGSYTFFARNINDPDTSLHALKEGFKGYGRVVLTLFLSNLFIFLWGMLFIIPAIIKNYSYRLVPYIVKDYPELSAMEVITKSRQMMKGSKWRTFVLDISFWGWFLLSGLTFGMVGLFWANPYYQSTNAALYMELKGRLEGSGAASDTPQEI